MESWELLNLILNLVKIVCKMIVLLKSQTLRIIAQNHAKYNLDFSWFSSKETYK